MKTRLLLLMLLSLFAVPCFALAAEKEEPVIYVIKQGDTLWGLSERFIKDPKYWPNMWAKNSQITNPHLIYPGQMLRVFSDRLEFVPKEQTASASSGVEKAASVVKPTDEMQDVAAEKSYLFYGSERFLLEKEFNPIGTIIGIHNDRIVVGMDDIVYTDIGTSQGAKDGEKFSVFKKDVTLAHPLTSEVIGTKVTPLGTLQLTAMEDKSSRAIIINSSREISSGAYLMRYNENRRSEVPLKATTKELKGYIVESYSGNSIIAAGDIVCIDLGKVQGAEAGNMLYIVRDVTLDKRNTEVLVDKLPQELLGALVILKTGNKMATALVVKSIDTIYKGDRIISVTK